MALNPAELQQPVRLAIYQHIIATGRPPSVHELAASHDFDANAVAVTFRLLADAHIVVLKPGTVQLWSVPPFSAVPTSFRVRTTTGSWYAPCAWDMFGVPAALKCDATLDARCAWSGESLPGAVRHGSVSAEGIVHLEVPARRFWDDIFYT